MTSHISNEWRAGQFLKFAALDVIQAYVVRIRAQPAALTVMVIIADKAIERNY